VCRDARNLLRDTEEVQETPGQRLDVLQDQFQVRLQIAKGECAFRRIWTAIPFETGHPVHGKVDSRSEATHGVESVYSVTSSLVNLGLSFRRDSPSRLRV
jgi:hypothetical protein